MTATTDGPLPRGRHNLTREQVATVQRDRMVRALARAMAEHGYVGTSVRHVTTLAGVSRETFYQQFSSKHDCFLVAMSLASDGLEDRLVRLAAEPGTTRERIERLFDRYLESLLEAPDLARLFLVEAYAAGPEAMVQRTVRQRSLSAILARALEVEDPAGRFACDLLVSGISAMVTTPLVVGDVEALHALREPLTEMALRLLA